jgi:hypothetical protein
MLRALAYKPHPAAECEALMDLDAVKQDPSRVLKGIAAWVGRQYDRSFQRACS